jgi:Kef-type K+ transport system membrane component KefB
VEVILFTVVGIALYLVTGALLSLLEKIHGDPLPQRNIVFFIIILALSLPTFSVLRSLLGESERAHQDYEKQQAADGSNQPPEAH